MLADKLRRRKARARLKYKLQRVYFGVASVLYLGVVFSPNLSVFAQDAGAPTIDPAQQGPQQPTGPENTSYTYNPETQLWENEYYTWSPATKQTAPKTEQNYSYNPGTNKWDGEYVYSPEQQKYVKPAPSSTTTSPAPTQTTQTTSNSGTEPAANHPSAASTSQKPVQDIPVKLPSEIKVSNSNSGAFELFFNANISVNVDAEAKSGDVSVLQNTTGGSALSGNTSSEAYIMNLIQSMFGSGGSLPELYTSNIQGDHFGDIILNPGNLQDDLRVSQNVAQLEIKVDNNINVENNVNLLAKSGNATIASNTSAGDATSGDASAIANIINMINSSIAANQSFIGVLNVNGNLNGDILFADDLTEQLIAANVPTSQIALNNFSLDSELDNNIDIHDNVNLAAVSGDAEVKNNTSAGNATSGNSQTSLTVFNLIGHNVQADKAMLVFVNVGGQWTGFITNAPAGSTAAAFGSGVSSSTNSLKGNIDAENNIKLINNVNLLAQTGNATVAENTSAGNATSGNATAQASIANIVGTSFNLSNYLTWLFINVTKDWCGSVGTNTACGNPVIPPISNPISPTHSTTYLTEGSRETLLPEQVNLKNVRFFSVNFAANETSKNISSPIDVASISEIVPEPSEQVFASPKPSSLSSSWVVLGMIFLGYLIIFQGGRILSLFRKS